MQKIYLTKVAKHCVLTVFAIYFLCIFYTLNMLLPCSNTMTCLGFGVLEIYHKTLHSNIIPWWSPAHFVLWPRPLPIKWWTGEDLASLCSFSCLLSWMWWWMCLCVRMRASLIDWQVIMMRGSAYVPVSAAVTLLVSSSTLFFTFTWVIIYFNCV